MANTDYLAGHGAVLPMKGESARGVRIQSGGSALWPPEVKGAVITVEDVTLGDKDIHIPVTTVDNFHVLYKFGQDFGEIAVTGTIALGCGASSTKAEAIKKAQETFNSFRLSKTDKPVDVSMERGGGKWRAVFTRFDITRSNPAFQTVQYALRGLIVPPAPK